MDDVSRMRVLPEAYELTETDGKTVTCLDSNEYGTSMFGSRVRRYCTWVNAIEIYGSRTQDGLFLRHYRHNYKLRGLIFRATARKFLEQNVGPRRETSKIEYLHVKSENQYKENQKKEETVSPPATSRVTVRSD